MSNYREGHWLIPYHEQGMEYHREQLKKTSELVARLALEASGQLRFDFTPPKAEYVEKWTEDEWRDMAA